MPKKTQKERTAMMYAFWNKWGGGDPSKVIRTKGITKDAWYVEKITNATPENVTKVTPDKTDITNI